MFPGARISDPVTHDQTAPCGVIAVPLMGRPLTVFTEKMISAVVGDFVQCTGVTSAGPVHPPLLGPPPAFMPPPPFAPIVKGSVTVKICKLPAARWVVDTAGCGTFLGFPAMAAMRTVKIGG